MREGQRGLRLLVLTCVAAVFSLAYTGQALAVQTWRVDSLSNTTAQPGDILDYRVQLTNVGDTPMDGSPIIVTVTLPEGLSVSSPSGPVSTSANPHFNPFSGVNFQWLLFDTSSGNFPSTCTQLDGSPLAGGETAVRCQNSEQTTATGSSSPWQMLFLPVDVAPDARGTLTTRVSVQGGGAAPVEAVDPVRITSAPPGFGIDAFDGQLTDAAGNPYTQAGGHPYAASVQIDFNTLFKPLPLAGPITPVEAVKDLIVDLPPGLVGDPTAVAQCTGADLANTGGNGLSAQPLCPADAQVGTVLVRFNGFPSPSAGGPFPVFNVVPPPNVPARFGFNVVGSVIILDAELRSGGDYGLSVKAENISEALALAGSTVTFWGVPADASHDLERACPGQLAPQEGGASCRSGAQRRAFLRNPTSCPDPGVGLPTTAHAASWAHPGDFKEATWFSHALPAYPAAPEDWGAPIGPTACARVPFTPSFSASPVSSKAGSPSGFQFDLSLPQTDDPTFIGQSDLREAVVTLPAGVRVSPASAHGLGACSPSQIGLHSGGGAACPDDSKIGSIAIDTPVLPDPLRGAIYLARQNDNPFGSLLSVYLVANGPGVVVKLAGKVDADPLSGQLTATFDDNPQLPFSNLHLEFKGGPRAALVTPRQCGTYATHAELTSWSGKIVVIDSTFAVSRDGNGGPCPPSQFSPDFEAGTENPIAGSNSSFKLRLARDDDDQELGGVTVNMPNGLTGKIADVPLCSSGDVKADTCPEASKVGSVAVGAGAGSDPFFITNGRAYLTGRYKGAPFGLAIAVPAVAGPFDLGTVTVRQSIFVDKHTSELRIVSDPLPTILQGIPLDVREVRVDIDRPGFIVNPTSCAQKRIDGVITSTEGATANVSSRFQAADCARLEFRPRMALSVGAKGHTTRNSSVPFSTVVKMPRESANLKYVRVTLPKTINARLPIINRACTRAQYEAGRCDGARAGTAVAKTPLLKDPLRGNVYFVKNGKPLPDLFIALRGQVDFDLIGRVSIPGSTRLSTTFDAVPDVPITSFQLKLVSGAQGPVGAATNLCTASARRAKAELDFIGQNGKVRQLDQRVTIRGCGKRAASHRRTRGR